MSWSKLGGGDHDGNDWTPTGDTISGVHSNIGTLTISGTTTLNQGALLELYANTIVISGTLNGEGKGYSGGTGPGTGCSGFSNYEGAGGGAYGGAGGKGDGASRCGGTPYGDNTTAVIQMGSGGGNHCGEGWYGYGGYGGGGVILCANYITISGTINLNGTNGIGVHERAGGGGAGGGLLVICGSLTCVGSTMSCDAGNGALFTISAGGGGGGGRAKFWYKTTDTGPSAIATQALGTAGGLTATNGTAGEETACNTMAMMLLNTDFGQTFNFNIAGAPTLTKIDLYVETVSTPGNTTLTVYNNTGKSINYGSKTNNIVSTGVNTFTFATPIELPDGLTSYYFEVTTTSVSSLVMGFSAGDKYAGGDYYLDGAVIHGIDAYMKIYLYTHMYNPRVYNISDKSIKCNVANIILTGAEHRINANGTGSIKYSDDFTTSKYLGDRAVMENVTYDDPGDKIDIASGYIYYKIDTLYPIVGIPTLNAIISITSGSPTIQIAKEVDGLPNTWYDITDPVVTGVLTEYNLECDDLTFEGKTVLYFRINSEGGDTSVNYMVLDTELDTTSAQVPMVDVVGDSTFRIDQGAGSNVDGLVTLFYNDAVWGGV